MPLACVCDQQCLALHVNAWLQILPERVREGKMRKLDQPAALRHLHTLCIMNKTPSIAHTKGISKNAGQFSGLIMGHYYWPDRNSTSDIEVENSSTFCYKSTFTQINLNSIDDTYLISFRGCTPRFRSPVPYVVVFRCRHRMYQRLTIVTMVLRGLHNKLVQNDPAFFARSGPRMRPTQPILSRRARQASQR
jgi:hypothetical protein